MFVYEVAAELKAQTERTVVLYSKATIKSVVNAITSTYQYLASFSDSARSASRNKNRRNKRTKRSRRIPPPSPSFASTMYDDEMENLDLDVPVPTDVNQLMEQMRLLQEQMATFAQLQASVAQANALAAASAPAQTSVATAPVSGQIASQQPTGSQYIQIDPNAPECPILDLDQPVIRAGASQSYSGFYVSSSTTPSHLQSTPIQKPAAKPQGGGMSIVDALKNGRPALRSVSKEKEQEAEYSSVFNKQLRPSNTQNKAESEDSQFQPVPLMINGKKLQTQNIPGQEAMSFSDVIKVASKVSLKRAEVERSPGGTPLKRAVQHDSVFSARLQERFKSLRRESLNTLSPLDENDKENWE